MFKNRLKLFLNNYFQVYDDINSFKVNDVVEFIGILSVDPSMANFQDNR